MVESPIVRVNLSKQVTILAYPGEEIESMERVSRLRKWIPAIIIMIVIFWASSTPSSQIPNIGPWDWLVKKGAHFSGYTMLALTLIRGSQSTKKWDLFWVMLFCGLYAASDEFHQAFVSGRNPSLIDVGIDVLGSSFALVLFFWSAPLRRLILK